MLNTHCATETEAKRLLSDAEGHTGRIMMNDRERFLETMRFGHPDRIPYWDHGTLPGTLERWRKEGLPEDATIVDYFGLDRREIIAVDFAMCPRFTVETLEEQGAFRIFRDMYGNIQRGWKDGRAGMPEFIEHPIKTHQDFLELKRRYDPATPERYPQPWAPYVTQCRTRDHTLYLQAFRHVGFFGPLRNWMGLEPMLYAFCDNPTWIHEMIEFIADYIIGIVERIGSEIQLDYVTFFEDIGYKHSTLISPAFFREFMMGPYRRVTDTFRKYGTEFFFADSDGDNDPLVPLWMEAGVNGFSPMEIQSEGMGPAELRAKYPDLLLYGGVDKRVLARDKQAVYDEVLRKIPVMDSGAYIPIMDHQIPPDARFDNYVYYWEVLKAVAEGRTPPDPADRTVVDLRGNQ
jgi:uroporphyrinogen decarboxylase